MKYIFFVKTLLFEVEPQFYLLIGVLTTWPRPAKASMNNKVEILKKPPSTVPHPDLFVEATAKTFVTAHKSWQIKSFFIKV